MVRKLLGIGGAVGFVLLTLIGLLSVLAPTVSAVEAGNIGGKPARPDPANPRTSSIFIKYAAPGETVTDAVQLVNFTNETKTLLVYATDSIVSSGGVFGCAQMVDEKKSVGSWVKMSRGEVTLPSGGTDNVTFTVTPTTDSDVGENDGCIVIQEKDAAPQKVEGERSNINLSFRTAIRLAVFLPGEVKKDLKILGYAAMKANDGTYTLKPRVKNNGNVSLDTELDTYTGGILGGKVDHYSQDSPMIRGVTSDWNIPYKPSMWGGWFKSYFTISFDANVANGLGTSENKNMRTLTSETIYFFVTPSPLAAIIELAVLLAFVWVIRYLIRRFILVGGRKERDDWKYIYIATMTDITTLAKTYGVSWKKLAKVNHLKAPYILRPGDKILVPSGTKGHRNKNIKSLISRDFSGISKDWNRIRLTTAMDIESVAKSYNVSWKLLAKVNKLKPPYALKQGDEILVPFNVNGAETMSAGGVAGSQNQVRPRHITVTNQTDIESLATVYGISWKVLAKANKLKPPYILHRGDELIIPDATRQKSLSLKAPLNKIPYFKRRKLAKEWDEITIAAQADDFIMPLNDIESIARAYGVPWQELAKINRLHSPYTLKPGDKIKVPRKQNRP